MIVLCFAAVSACAQELQPRAYLPTPVGVNFVGVSYSSNAGGLLFDPSLPIEDANVKAHITTFSFAQSLGIFGRSAQVLGIVPYAVADLTGKLAGTEQYRYRSGLADCTFRFAMNIWGAPAMHLKDYKGYRPKTILGASATVIAPTGQYDPNVAINIGANRWAVKPELGLSHTRGKWAFEGAIGAWLYTSNTKYYGNIVRTQDPLGSVQAHLVRILPHRTWLAGDATFYTGGRTHTGAKDDATYQGNWRAGVTFGVAVTPRQAIRIAYFDGVIARVGSDIRSISVAYQVLWLNGR